MTHPEPKPPFRDELIAEAAYYLKDGLHASAAVEAAEKIVDRVLQLHKPWTYAQAWTAYSTLNDARDQQKTALARAVFDEQTHLNSDSEYLRHVAERRIKYEQSKYDDLYELVNRFYSLVNDLGGRLGEAGV